MLLHQSYSPNFAMFDIGLFRSLKNSLNEATLNSDEALNQQLLQFSPTNTGPSMDNYKAYRKMAKDH